MQPSIRGGESGTDDGFHRMRGLNRVLYCGAREPVSGLHCVTATKYNNKDQQDNGNAYGQGLHVSPPVCRGVVEPRMFCTSTQLDGIFKK